MQRVDWVGDDGKYDENIARLAQAYDAAVAETERPSFIALRTVIAWPAPNAQNTGKSHGSALGADEVAATKKLLGFDPSKTFDVAPEVLAHAREVVDRGRAAHAEWQGSFDAWAKGNSGGRGAPGPDVAAAAARTAGRTRCRSSRPTPRGWPPARPRARC